MAFEFQTKKADAKVMEAPSWRSFSVRPKRVSARDRMFFVERLALLLETGSSLNESLRLLQRQSENPTLAKIIESLNEEILAGRPLSQAMARHPQMFPPTYLSLVQASEKGGFLHKVLLQLLEMEEKRERLRSNLVSALSYPAFLIVFSVAVIIFILVVVFPKFGTMFETIWEHLPWTTRLLMGLSDLTIHYWHVMLLSLVATLWGLGRWLRSEGGIELTDALKLRLVFVKDLFIQVYLIHVLRITSLSLANGVPMLETLQSCRNIVGNVVFRRFIVQVAQLVADGRGIAVGFEDSPIIPPLVKHMIHTGEESGDLARVSERMADFYERELDKKIKLVSKIIEPLLLLVMGAIVGLIVASLILPIFKLSKAVR